MINAMMRSYSYSTYGGLDSYGQPQLSDKSEGKVLLSINLLNTNIVNNVIYKEANYIALTTDNNINENYVINYGELQLKVLYINKFGRYKQVFLKVM